MVQVSTVLSLFLLLICLVDSSSEPKRTMIRKPGARLAIEYYKPKSITRYVKNAKGVAQEHIFRVCNGKNKTKCGYWENVKTKKKVGPKTTYDKKKDMLIIAKVSKLDAGTYITPSYDTVTVIIQDDKF
ncbi:TransThyretin-Related family domain [Caenorhabditis elegans]|uniref:TransThyretin-Related family domain n=1 Tax=Caenorhabditis elegans TaxID=6239 RepID=Q17538_CAEEL|nr:TransThyretin-Related family domain [Caenorhabditis elegans]CCD62337.1 TransThyretin-Related family domain [Caenorhabditis elegans]|eukprot:NP_501025.2 Uncharacterized protein CELE_C01B10.7 [Caenorhabditis elegans]